MRLGCCPKPANTVGAPISALAGNWPVNFASGGPVHQVQAKVKFILVVVRLHVGTKLVESLVMRLFLQVRQLVHRNHS